MGRKSGIKLRRAGGLSPVDQDNDRAPEKKGVWAFIWPHFELFFLGSTGPEGKTYGNDSRYHQLQREGWREWVHEGKIWTRLEVPKSPIYRNGWFLTTGYDLNKYMGKHIAQATKHMRQSVREYHEDWGSEFDIAKVCESVTNPFTSWYSKDEFEVFVPNPPN